MDELKIFEGVGGKGNSQKIKLPIFEEKDADEPVFIQVDGVEDNEA